MVSTTTGRSVFTIILATVFLFLLIVQPSALSAKSDPPIYVEADHMTSLENKNSVLFTGNVDAKQGDVRIRSDEMTVYYTPEKKGKKGKKKTGKTGSKQQVEKIVCVGNVEVSRDDWLGTAKKMYYISRTKQVVLVNKAKAWQGPNMVSGEKIIYYIDENRSEVIGSTKTTIVGKDKKKKKSRVKMTIVPGKK